MITLPTCAYGDLGSNIVRGVEWPIVNDLWIVFFVSPFLAVHDQGDNGEVDVDRVVVPLIITNLGQFPSPFSRPENKVVNHQNENGPKKIY